MSIETGSPSIEGSQERQTSPEEAEILEQNPSLVTDAQLEMSIGLVKQGFESGNEDLMRAGIRVMDTARKDLAKPVESDTAETSFAKRLLQEHLAAQKDQSLPEIKKTIQQTADIIKTAGEGQVMDAVGDALNLWMNKHGILRVIDVVEKAAKKE